MDWPEITAVLALIFLVGPAASQSSLCLELDGGVTDCSGKNLTYIPRNLPASTKILRLEGNLLERIEAADFPSVMNSLEELVLTENTVRYIDTATFCHKLPNLRILKLTRNKLTSLPDLRFCSSLEEIHGGSNEIRTIDGTLLTGLSRLEKLDLGRNNLTSLSADMFPTNTSLKTLILNNNNLAAMSSDSFTNVPNLERLRLSRNKITTISRDLFSKLQNLQSLDLSKNRLTQIGHLYFTNLKKLKHLNLERNRLNHLLDGSFYDCQALNWLNLEGNLLTEITAGPFFGLVALQELYLAHNNISAIGDSVWAHATSIRLFDMSENNLGVILKKHFAGADSMRTLRLAKNNIQTIELESFADLENLDMLDLSGNSLSDSIQASSATVISALTSLTVLNLKGNRLQSISSKLLRGLESLQTLDLSNNPVTTVESYAFSALPHLANLGIRTDRMVCDCKISWLPPWLQDQRLTNTVQATCAVPRSLRGQSIFNIESNQFVCDAGEMPVTPFITREVQPTNALRGSNVTLTCIATTSSQSPVEVEWIKDNKIIPKESGLIETDASTADGRVALYTTYLKLTNVDQSNEGEYQCGFKNDFGRDYSDNARLQVLVFPSFTNIPNNVTVKTGQDAKLLCEAQGYPQPYLSWSKDGGQNFPAARDRRFHVNPDNLNEFIIKDVQWQDRGTYFCNATNIAGSIISNATVNVMVPPRFTEQISCTHTRAGDYLLKCQADGNPKAPIVWYKDGQIIQASGKFIFSVTYNNLFIIDGTPEDSGVYMCSATNLLGQVTQQCEINFTLDDKKDTITEVSPVGEIGVSTKKATQLDQSTITGLIVIAVVCCVVGTSLVWVVIIYKTRRRQNGPDDNGDTTTPLNGGVKQGDSTHKIGDSVSNSSSQTKSDSFLEYRGMRDSPSTFSKTRGQFPTMDSELAAAMEPLNPNQESQDSLMHDSGYIHPYPNHTMSGYRTTGHHNMMPVSTSDFYVSENAHPFSTFQPSRHYRTVTPNSHQSTKKPHSKHSISAEYIPYIDKKHPPPDLAAMLHQLRAPNQPPQAVVTPVHKHSRPTANSSSHHIAYEEPGYMNLPRSAVTPSLPKNSNISNISGMEPHSDYMNLEPKDTHIYQNTSILNITPGSGLVGPESDIDTPSRGLDSEAGRVDSDTDDRETSCSTGGTSSESSSTSQSNEGSLHNNHPADLSLGAHELSAVKPDQNNTTLPQSDISSSTDTTHNTANHTNSPNKNRSLNSSKFYSRSANDSVASSMSPRRREGLADSSFVERKYGLIFTDDFPNCANETKTSDVSRSSHRSRDL